MLPERITQRNILRVLIGGFTLVILLLVAAGVVGVRSVQSIQQSAGQVMEEQVLTNRLIDGVQREQRTLRAIFFDFERDLESVDQDVVLSQLEKTDQRIDEMLASAERSPDAHLWQDFKKAEKGFSDEARRLLALEDYSTASTRDLFRRHEEVFDIVTKLIRTSHQKAALAQSDMQDRSRELVRESMLLLGACVVLALLCAVLTVWMTTGLFRKMELQTSELSRVSWHMLESQETVARRFSHELHDELGQSLTAVKANLVAIQAAGGLDRKRLEDCGQLVDEAIRNVRELSQLLRPTILDDFGLDASLRWLGERFTERTGIAVEYNSNFSGRVADETETHLFRIAQEALTNVARHSKASKVKVELRESGRRMHLLIEDDGKGLENVNAATSGGLGMIGMRARAHSAGGEVTIHSRQGHGVSIEVWTPLQAAQHEAKDTHLVGG